MDRRTLIGWRGAATCRRIYRSGIYGRPAQTEPSAGGGTGSCRNGFMPAAGLCPRCRRRVSGRHRLGPLRGRRRASLPLAASRGDAARRWSRRTARRGSAGRAVRCLPRAWSVQRLRCGIPRRLPLAMRAPSAHGPARLGVGTGGAMIDCCFVHFDSGYSGSGTMSIAPAGHSVTHSPQPLQ